MLTSKDPAVESTVALLLMVWVEVTVIGPTNCARAASDVSKSEVSTAGRKRRHPALGDAKLDRASERRSCLLRLIAWRGMFAPVQDCGFAPRPRVLP